MSGCAIFGAGGHARVVASILRAQGRQVAGCFDDSYTGNVMGGEPERILGVPLLGSFGDILVHRDRIRDVFLGLGDNLARERAFLLLSREGFELPALVHPAAVLEPDVVLGDGTVVCTGAILGVQVVVGRGSLINTGVIVDHESAVGSFTHLAPRVTIAGRTTVGDRCFVGVNASIADKIAIGDSATVGAGSVILQDVPAAEQVVGVHH